MAKLGVGTRAPTARLTPARRGGPAVVRPARPAWHLERASAAAALERQADAAAARIAHGERDVARTLGVAPVAAAVGATSPGAPLPEDLRLRFERGFGADLSAVRLHHDAAGRAAVRARGARGFAAGRDVFVDLDDLRSEAGRALLAHELAHALQQVGRPGPDGRLAVRSLTGTAPVQRADPPAGAVVDKLVELSAYLTSRDWPALRAAYQAKFPADADVKAAITAFDTDYFKASATVDPTTKRHGRAKDIYLAAHKALGHARELYVDALKLIDEHAWAGELLFAHSQRLPTGFRKRAAYLAARGHGGGKWLVDRVKADPLLGAYYPKVFIERIRAFLFSPYASPLNLDVGMKFESKVEAERDRMIAETGISTNELALAAVEAMRQLDVWRVTVQRSVGIARAKTLPVAVIRAHALWFTERDYATTPPTDEAIEVGWLLGAVWPDVQAVAREAEQYWGNVGEYIWSAERLGIGAPGLDAVRVRTVLAGVAGNPRFATLGAELDKIAAALLAVTPSPAGDVLPAPATYAARVEAARTSLLKLEQKHLKDLPDLHKKGLITSDDALQIGLVASQLEHLAWQLGTYDRKADDAFTKTYKTPDHRVAARIRAARSVAACASVLGLTGATTATAAVLAPRVPAVALLGTWEEDPDVKPGELATELGSDEAYDLTGTGLSWRVLGDFLFGLYYAELAKHLDTILGKRETNFDNTSSILGEAVTAASAAPRPRRYVMGLYEVAYVAPPTHVPDPSGALVAVPAAQRRPRLLSTVVMGHPRFKELATDPDSLYTVPDNLAVHRRSSGLVAWRLPAMDKLVTRLKLIPGLDAAVAATKPDAGWFPWLMALGKLAATQAAATSGPTATATSVTGALGADYTSAQTRAYALGRRATTHTRIVMAAATRDHWKKYDEDKPGTWELPAHAYGQTKAFVDSVWPPEDQVLQVTAFVLETGHALYDAIYRKATIGRLLTRRAEVRAWVTPLLVGALEYYAGHAAEVDAIADRGLAAGTYAAVVTKLTELRNLLVGAYLGNQFDTRLTVTKTDDNGGGTVEESHWNRRLVAKANEGAKLGGTTLLITGVFETFLFYPAFTVDRLGVAWPGGAANLGKPLFFDANNKLFDPGDRPLVEVSRVDSTGAAQTERLTARKHEQLADLMYQLGTAAALESLDELKGALEVFADLVTTALEFIPGAGQAVMAANFVARVLQFLVSPEFDEVVAVFKDEGVEGLSKRLMEMLSASNLEPVNLATSLLFHHSSYEPAFAKQAPPEGKAKQRLASKPGRFALVAGVFARLGRVVSWVFAALRRLQKRASGPVRAAQTWVVSHPGAAMGVRLVDDNIDRLKAVDFTQLAGDLDAVFGGATGPDDHADWLERIKGMFEEGMAGVIERGRDALDVVRHLELPEEIIPLEPIVDYVIDLLVNRLGARYKYGVKAVRLVLEQIGVWPKIISLVTAGLKKIGDGTLDPNEIYRNHIRDELAPTLQELRDEFVGQITTFLKDIPFLSGIVEPAKGEAVTIEPTGADVPEVQPSGHDPTAPLAPPPLPSAAAGHRLPPPIRARAETALGHDLGHVRVHEGAAGARVAAGFAASAVTTGSHVFLGSGLAASSPSARPVLHHELAHVIQQTGPRPLGGRHDASPRLGAPGVGLRVDAGLEAAADRAAARTGAAPPLAVSGASPVGLQPKLGVAFGSKFFHRFLKQLRTTDEIAKTVKEVEGHPASASDFAHDPQGKALADALPEALFKALKALKLPAEKGQFRRPFGEVATTLVDVALGFKDEIKKAIPALVVRSRDAVKPKLTGADKDVPANPWVQPHVLERELREYLYGRTGLAIAVKFTTKKGGADLRERPVVDVAKPIAKVEVGYVHLPFFHGNATLWNLAVKNTFDDKKRWPRYSVTTHPEYKAAARIVLEQMAQPRPDVWDSATFRFSLLTARRIEEVAFPPDKLDPKALPTRGDYLDARRAPGPAKTDNIGLRLGTHAQYGPAGTGGVDRESHHTIQFLLFEYLRNDPGGAQPFPQGGLTNDPQTTLYPGVLGSKLDVDKIGFGTRTVDVGTYFPGRGGAMPTILIAAPTHRADVHVKAEKPDEGPGKSAQRWSVDNTFRAALAEGGVKELMKDKAQLEALKTGPVEVLPGRKVDRAAVQGRIFSAASRCYREMRDEMMPKLERALRTVEVTYYNDKAALAGKADRITTGDVDAIFTKVKEDATKAYESSFQP